ncbi:PBPe domain-containing protein [Heracleum sosnowskyi]|uniref:PBPe domain-containing protein n=1 Tax=Heracleum sosnowskyi TaxID=360622 RepID=A0AAD8MNF4_9APIA|nr:PBPe domain-containing protein [Heracleum sosnowskyi]
MPTEAKPMKFVVPGETSFEKFVKVQWSESLKEINYSGFCIDVFFEVLKLLEKSYSLPYEFIPYNGTYDDLVDLVADKTVDAVIGDVTILANRSKYVDFTQPFAESGLTMIVPVKPQAEKAWIFLKPFSKGMWGMTAAILVYTVLIVWLLERRSNPEFDGPWHFQLSIALWFTSSSLFFAQREQIYNNHARVAVSVWLFVVLALSSSYTATLSSMLTAPRLEPNVTDIGWLKKNNAVVGCDGSSFVKRYLENVLGFNPVNIKNLSSEYNYPGEFESGSITAAFLEVPYEKTFLNHHCQGYTVAGSSGRYGGDRFGGLGFGRCSSYFWSP